MRFLIASIAAAAAFSPFAAFAQKPAPQPPRALMTLYDAPGLARACEEGLKRAQADIRRMEAKQGPGAIFDEWNRLSITIEDVVNSVYLQGSVSPDKAVRDAAEPCLQKYTTLQADLFQDEKLFARVKAAQPANPHQAKLKKDLLEGFEDTGVSLPPDKRRRAKEIFEKIEELRQAFDRNIREDPTKVTFKAEDLEGLPESYRKAHAPDAQGNIVLGLDYPSYLPFIQNAKSEEARRRYYMAKLNEGGAQNLDLLLQIFQLRKELASLYGLPTFADYALRRKMAGTPEAVNKFLADVKDAVTKLEVLEIADLRTTKARELDVPSVGVQVHRWDVPYYSEKIRREQFKVDQEKLRKYFPTDKAVDYTFLVSQTLYGVKFVERKVPVWHPDVRYFDVVDAKTGKFISGFYLDLFPREGKFNHAAAFPIRGVSRLAKRTPVSALVTNFNREGLDHDELQTLMHEFGHVLHGVLSQADYNPQAGTSVKGDFVEAPSQMFEEWARREQPLELFKKVCPDCPHLTPQEIRQLEAARRFGQGIRYSRQWLYAVFDMALATDPKPPLAVWKSLESATPLGYVEGTSFPSSFRHIAENYAAGYYGYMWSEVIALDMLSAFKANMLDPAVGARYRDTILSQGGQVEEMDMVKRFLGRAPSNEAFFAEITGRR
jgi:thimet oligopeptidase